MLITALHGQLLSASSFSKALIPHMQREPRPRIVGYHDLLVFFSLSPVERTMPLSKSQNVKLTPWKHSKKYFNLVTPLIRLSERVNINVALFSSSRTFGDRPRYFVPWSSDVDDT
ncbi:hypothetical protein TNCV_1088281 [Trichonephila clavipes]|uniref:Uncharacterized protein n=1 Tax=Trichonephila clavipes TaxID=2585209 RepID=A0A8X6SX31_TRICX|nr:hypothetical protein TNCV_1088281 [Trichonephila clavipes]